MEAISHLTKGLELLKTLPDTPERAQQELTLQITLGVPLMATKGFAAPEVERVYTRARELCQQVGETPQLFPVLWGLWAFYLVRAELQTARELGGAAPAVWPRAYKTRLSSWRLTVHWGAPCSGLESLPRPEHTWSRGLPSMTPSSIAPCLPSMAAMTLG